MTDNISPSPPPPPPANGGFDMNHPTIISLLYLASFFTGITGLVGVILAYVWRDGAEAWEASHLTYHIRTFWIGVLGTVIGVVLSIILIGFFLIIAVAVWMAVRSVLSMVKAQKREPMPDPQTWLF
ncbi:hypothetical protein [Erythrobacter sp. HKB08]|uniref:DUF4870 family protein n=1 Tax=Erythrobacter sp. HKB08 TaxID=2502843 RepID=UPI0010089F6F|nr:hypothetical protein [Erythrobacter sp. HKB08]